MPLDPQAEAFLRSLRDQGVRPPHELTPAEARAQMTPPPPPYDPVASVRDLAVPGPGGLIPLRAYVPAVGGSAGALPGLVYYHGGGWVMGTLDAYDGLCRTLAAESACAVVSVDYRLAPEHKYPAAAEDAYAAAAWVGREGGSLGIDPGRLAVGGDSAGGNLAAAVCLMARERGGPRLACQALLYPIVDHSFDTPSYKDNAEGYHLTKATMAWFWRQYLAREDDGRQPFASPLRAGDLRGLPPAVVLTAEYDPLRDEAEEYARRLEAAGVPVTLLRFPGMIHGFLRRPRVFDAARPALRRVGQALRERTSLFPA